MLKSITYLLLLGILFCHTAAVHAALVIEADKAAIHTEGALNPGGGWNLYSNGRVGSPVRIATAGRYQIVIRAYGSVAGGVWPEMALLVDERPIQTVDVGSATAADYRFDVDLPAGTVEIAAAFLNDALIGKEDRNLYLNHITISAPPGAPEPVVANQRDLDETAQEREAAVRAAIPAAIEKNRKSDATLRIVDAAGKPHAGATVTIELTNHEFLFGCNIYGFDRYPQPDQNAAYKSRFAELFNYATVGFYWRWYEPQPGKPNYDYTDKVVDWCGQHNIRMKGHPLLWGHEAGIPTWSKGQPIAQIQQQRVQDIMNRYRGRITLWEVVNEPAHLPEPKIDQPYRWARQCDPTAHLIVNDYHVMADGCPDFFKLLKDAILTGVPFDGIGIQAHEPPTMRFPLERVQRTLDDYAALGKSLNITEFTPTSGGKPIVGSYVHGVWDEAAQADYAVKFYRVCFAHPAVQAITWWDLCDHDSWLPGGGMLHPDLSPKPAYEQLRRLIHDEWTTHVTATTDRTGHLSFRGFRGTYRIIVDTPTGKVERQFAVKKDGGAITIAL